MKKPTPSNNVHLSDLSHEVLKVLKEEFAKQARSSNDLAEGYIGPSLSGIQQVILENGLVSRVDYDLALKELEEHKLVGTGPMAMYDNPPNSGVFVMAMFSKREYIYLRETGYRAARDRTQVPLPKARSNQTVQISGNTFYQSPIGVGGQVSQQLNFDVSNETDAVQYLIELLTRAGTSVNELVKTDLTQMISFANAGDMAAVKPIYQRIFGAVSEPIKQLAYGVIAAIITKQMALS